MFFSLTTITTMNVFVLPCTAKPGEQQIWSAAERADQHESLLIPVKIWRRPEPPAERRGIRLQSFAKRHPLQTKTFLLCQGDNICNTKLSFRVCHNVSPGLWCDTTSECRGFKMNAWIFLCVCPLIKRFQLVGLKLDSEGRFWDVFPLFTWLYSSYIFK